MRELPAEGLCPRPRLRDTWRFRTPPEQLAELRAHRVRIGTWGSRTHLRGSGSSATGAEHFHLWDTWRHRTRPRAGSGSGTVGPVRWSRTSGVRLLSSLGRKRSAFSRADSLPSSEAEARARSRASAGSPRARRRSSRGSEWGADGPHLRTWAACWTSLSHFLSSRLEGGCRPSWARLPSMRSFLGTPNHGTRQQ